jgi:hypothetical protein
VVSVINDNARNEREILEESNAYAIQQQTHLPIVRVLCTTHIINLAICDFLNESQLMKKIMTIYSNIDASFKCPTFIKSRWYSIFDILLFIEANIIQINDLFKRKRLHESINYLQTIDWILLVETLQPVIKLLHLAEQDSAKLFDISPYFFTCTHQLECIYNTKNNYPEIMHCKLINRFSSTHEWTYLATTFFLTSSGVKCFRDLLHEIQSIFFNLVGETIENYSSQLKFLITSLKS